MSAKSNKQITVTENGPYKVTWWIPLDHEKYTQDGNGVSLDYEKIEDYPIGEEYHLCRCWKSENKPFCDGTHLGVHFDWTETADNVPYLEKAKDYEWPEANILDDEEYCVGARFCDRYGRAWEMIINPENPEELELATDECKKCPGWRLTIKTKDWKLIEPKFEEQCISALDDPYLWVRWPLQVKWGVPIISFDWKEYEVRNREALCRCGFSENKPFCDGSHLQDKYNGNGL
jgi:CDGSH-type Zn-finger protein